MKESIYTIPISEVFEPKKGCPLCALHDTLEDRWVQYITGAAMMEPDVRVKTNEEGFCGPHLHAMLEQRNRLSVALLLQTRLEQVLKELDSPTPAARGGSLFGKTKNEQAADLSCFVCNRIDTELARLADNIATVWAREESFQTLYAQQEFLCLVHHRLLTKGAQGLRGANRTRFLEATNALAKKGLAGAKTDIDAFCQLFDHRSSGSKPSDQVAGAVETAARKLCGREFDSGS